MRFPISPGVPILLPVRVYGATATRLLLGMLDTGASLMTIPPEDAAILGYDLGDAPSASIVTASGIAQAPRIVLSRVSVAGYEVADVPALCLDLSVAGASVLLGLSLLSRLNFSVDNKTHKLTVTDP